MRPLTEDKALSILRQELHVTLRAGELKQVRWGIGDDCAVVSPTGKRQVWTLDACLENVHFRFDWMTLADVAHRATSAAVSDLAAMGATPVGALAQVTLPPWMTARRLRSFARAQAEVCYQLGCPLVGGNLTAGPTFQVVTTAIGEIESGPVLGRNGARPGHEIWVLGSLGRARVGRLALQQRIPLRGAVGQCVKAFRRPKAMLAEGKTLLGRARACLDVSDGLLRDATNVARASGVALVLQEDALLAFDPVVRQACERLGEPVLEVILQGGEDYALLATGPARRRPKHAAAIGVVEEGLGVFLDAKQGRRALRGGFQHSTRPDDGMSERESRSLKNKQ